MKLEEILTMFRRFGFSDEYVRRSLAQGDSAHNAFEQLKTVLQLRWGDMCQELSAEQQKELRPVYDRLMAIRMTKRTTAAEQRQEAHRRVDGIFNQMKDEIQKRRDRNLREVFDLTLEYTQRQEAAEARKKAQRKAKKDKKHPDAIDVEYEEVE